VLSLRAASLTVAPQPAIARGRGFSSIQIPSLIRFESRGTRAVLERRGDPSGSAPTRGEARSTESENRKGWPMRTKASPAACLCLFLSLVAAPLRADTLSTVSGTVKLPAADPAAREAGGGVTLRAESGSFMRGQRLTWVDDSTATFAWGASIPGGTYRLSVWVDTDRDGLVSSGDYAAESDSISVASGATATPTLTLEKMDYADVAGTVTAPSVVAAGAYLWVFAVDLRRNRVVAQRSALWQEGTSQGYCIAVPGGSVAILALLDSDADGEASSGDYLGYYGGSGQDPPPLSNVRVSCCADVAGIDIQLVAYQPQ
jgi:hypothetical protein